MGGWVGRGKEGAKNAGLGGGGAKNQLFPFEV